MKEVQIERHTWLIAARFRGREPLETAREMFAACQSHNRWEKNASGKNLFPSHKCEAILYELTLSDFDPPTRQELGRFRLAELGQAKTDSGPDDDC